MTKTMTYATKSQLLDYVTKGEFKEFKDEMYEFRDQTYSRLSYHDQKFISLEKKIDDFRDEMRRSIGVLHDQFRSDLHASMEYFNNVDKKKVDQREFDALRLKINQRFFEGREVV